MIALIIALIVAGSIIISSIALTVSWLVMRIKAKRASNRIKRVAVTEIEHLINNCSNRVSMDELETLVNQGCSHVMVDVDSNNNVVGKVEVIKDANNGREIDSLLGSQGMVLVEV